MHIHAILCKTNALQLYAYSLVQGMAYLLVQANKECVAEADEMSMLKIERHQLAQTIIDIHMMPVLFAAQPLTYQWSSYASILNENPDMPAEEIFQLFGGKEEFVYQHKLKTTH